MSVGYKINFKISDTNYICADNKYKNGIKDIVENYNDW